MASEVISLELNEAFKIRLKQSVEDAKRKITKKDATPTIEITGEKGCSIVVGDIVDEKAIEFVVIYRGNDTKHHTPIIKIPKDRFPYIYFGNLVECRIFLKSKLLRVMFDRCDDCQVSVRTPIIGVIDFYKCKRTNASFRIVDSTYPQDAPIPLVTVEDCTNIQFHQSVDSILFVVKMSIDIYGVIVDAITGQRLSRHDLGKIIWDSQEQNFVTLSKTAGFMSVSSDYSLHQISHTIFVNPPDEDHDDHIDILGSTPPMRQSYIN
jgi:hypothetical protein